MKIKKSSIIYFLIVTSVFVYQYLFLSDIALIFFFFLLILYFSVKFIDENKIRLMVIFSYFISIIVIFYRYKYSIVNFPDTFKYLETLKFSVSANIKSIFDYVEIIKSYHIGYVFNNHVLYLIFNNIFVLYVSNVFYSKLAIIFLYRQLSYYFPKTIRNSTAIFLLMSSFIFVFSTEILKDSLTLLLAMLSLYFYTVFIKEKNIKYVIPLTISIIFLTITRIYSGFAILMGIIFDYLLNVESKHKTINVILTVTFGLIFLYNTNFKSYVDLGLSHLYNLGISILGIFKGGISILFSPFFWNIDKMFSVYK